MTQAQVIVIAKAPEPGRSKTRLSPTFTPDQASRIAEAALTDTLNAVAATPALRRLLVLDGEPGPWVPEVFEVAPQRGSGLGERLSTAFAEHGDGVPSLLIGMDTPQVTPDLLSACLEELLAPGADAVLGQADDGGWWAIGFKRWQPGAFDGVPMSTGGTVHAQRRRLSELGLTWRELPRLRDVDTADDAIAVAGAAPSTRFAAAVAEASGTTAPSPDSSPPAAPTPGRGREVTGIAVWVVLVAVAWIWGNWLNDHMANDMLVQAPPLAGHFAWSVPPSILLALAFAAASVGYAPRITSTLGWRPLLLVTTVVALTWTLVLVNGDGTHHLLSSVTSRLDYLWGVRQVGSASGYLASFTEEIGRYGAHVRSHPPGLVLLLWSMKQIGLGGALAAAALYVTGGAFAVPAVMLSVREVADEQTARAIAPFVALAPMAVWIGTSADALFAGVAAWGCALLILASSRTGPRSQLLAAGGGVVFTLALFLSYGLVLIGLVPLAVIAHRRAWRVLIVAAIPGVLVFAAFALAGFWWLEGLLATRAQYVGSVSRFRPYLYFLVANFAAFAVALGPATAAGLARLRDPRLWLLCGGALVGVAIADVSGMSKAEVERIWLPFAFWVLAATAALPREQRRWWLGAQVALGLLLQIGLRSPW